LDISVIHGDGSNTVAKKGGDGIGSFGHKHQSGCKTMVESAKKNHWFGTKGNHF